MREESRYVEKVPEYEVRDGVLCVDYGTWSLHMPLRVARLANARFIKMLREHEAEGLVVSLRAKR